MPRSAQEHERRNDKLDDWGFETMATLVVIIHYHCAGSCLDGTAATTSTKDRVKDP